MPTKACGCVAKRPACEICFFSEACAGHSPPNCCVVMTCGRSSWPSPMGTLNESTSEEVPFTYDTCPSSWVGLGLGLGLGLRLGLG